MGAQNFTSHELYDQTFDPNDMKAEAIDWKRDHWQYGPCRTSDYNVRWHLMRYRQPYEVPAMKPEHVALAYGETTGIVAVLANKGVNPVWEWDIVDGDGKVDNNGNFKAPMLVGLCPYAVVRATGLVNGIPTYRGYTVVAFM
jgi:hypothetical protein